MSVIESLLDLYDGKFALVQGNLFRIFFRPEVFGVSDPGRIYSLIKNSACIAPNQCRFTYVAFVLIPGRDLDIYLLKRINEGWTIASDIIDDIEIDVSFFQKRVGSSLSINGRKTPMKLYTSNSTFSSLA